MEQSEQIHLLAKALSQAQAEMSPAKKGQENPFFKSRYSDLTEVWNAAREPLTTNGLSVVQTMGVCETGVLIFTTLLHESGQWIRGCLKINPVKADPQSLGSAITYGRRYSFGACIGMVSELDDDANEASTPPKKETKKKEPVKVPTEPPKKSKYDFLKVVGEIKTELRELTGNDDAYYEILKFHGAKKSNEVTERDKQVELYKDLSKELDRIKNETPEEDAPWPDEE